MAPLTARDSPAGGLGAPGGRAGWGTTCRHALAAARARSCPVLVLVHLLAAAAPVLAQEGSTGEAGVVVGTAELDIRRVRMSPARRRACAARRSDHRHRPRRGGFLPVEWQGTVGWAWYLYVATPAGGTRSSSAAHRAAIDWRSSSISASASPCSSIRCSGCRRKGSPPRSFPWGGGRKPFPMTWARWRRWVSPSAATVTCRWT